MLRYKLAAYLHILGLVAKLIYISLLLQIKECLKIVKATSREA
jgi:hypothetical protein